MASYSGKNMIITAILLIALAAGVMLWAKIFHPASEATEQNSGQNSNENSGEENDWETSVSEGVTFKYPKDLGTSYIHTVDWPPKIRVINEPYVCDEAGSEVARAGKTEKRTINGNVYCVTIESEGAAGSTYTQYAYATEKDKKIFIFTFTLRSVQCLNYDEPSRSECENERTTFSVDTLLDRIASTTRVLFAN